MPSNERDDEKSGPQRIHSLAELMKYLDAKQLKFVGIAYQILNHLEDAEDAFGRMCLECIEKYEPGWFDAYEHPDQLLVTIVKRKALRLRREPKRRLAVLSERFTLAQAREDSDSNAIDKERVRQAIDRLPDDQKECILLCYFEKHTQLEIAEILDIEDSTVRGRLHRAKARLRELLKGFDPQ